MNHDTATPPWTKKRRRPALACLECRRRKVKCDRTSPCGQCTAHKSSCRYAEYEGARRQRQDQGSPVSGVGAANDVHSSVSCATDSSTMGRARGSRQGDFANGEQYKNATRPTINKDRNTDSEAESSRKPVPGEIHGALSKTRVFGHSHWMSTIPFIKRLSTYSPITPEFYSQTPNTNVLPSQASETFTRCKQLAREIKRRLPSRSALPDDLHASLPAREALETSVTTYFSTYESCYRILDRGQFQREYETYMERSPGSGAPATLLKILLLLCTIAPLHPDVAVRATLRSQAPRWIHVSQTWLSAPLEKDRLSVDGLQIHCLLLLARQTNRLGADLVWIAAGGLMRMAMQMGLHQDPDSLGAMGMAMAQKEIRRRLWYTILEMNVQAALDSGMAPLIREDEYDTQVPSDRHDGADDESGIRESYQSLLARSLPLRLEVTRRINSLRDPPAYEEVLHLGNLLSEVYRDATAHMACISHDITTTTTRAKPTHFCTSFLTHLLSRFLLCLHLPYAVQAPQAPIYSYSLKACLSAAQDLLALLDDPVYNLLLTTGGGPFRDLITRGGLVIFLDLVGQLEDDSSPFSRGRNIARMAPQVEDARRVVSYARERLLYGDTNVKGYVGLSMVMAQVEALLAGGGDRDLREAVGRAARGSLQESYEVLKAVAEEKGVEEGEGEDWTPGSGCEEGGFGGWDFGLGFDFDADIDLGLGLDFGGLEAL